jgi:hypothetical protein
MRKTGWIVLPALIVLATVAPSAAADDSAPVAQNNEGGYIYNFEDDPLQAAGLGSLGAYIPVARRAVRATLIRPRTAFVVELLKSVEHL